MLRGWSWQVMAVAVVTTGVLTDGLMFHSDAVTSQWDTWAFVENGTFYAYYLITEHSPGEGFGVATSADGIKGWIDHGYVWHSPDWAEHRWWEGTGAVWRAADFNKTGKYVINYSRCPGAYQQITFAESYNLINWTRPPPMNSSYFDIDTRYYKNPGRWDCIYSTPQDPSGPGGPRDGYPRYGWWTATAIKGDMGFGQTNDGVTWEALPSPLMDPPLNSETGAVEFFRYANGTKSGWYSMLGHGGMVVYSAATPDGPYTIQPKNPQVLTGACYFARFFRPATGDNVYITHQSYSHQGHTYIAPFKRAVVDDEGILRFAYFDTNGALKGNPLVRVSNTSAPWYMFDVNVSVGAIVEASLALPPPTLSVQYSGAVTDPSFVVEMTGGTRSRFTAFSDDVITAANLL